MELASLLADEQFSDHPRSVCPVIGVVLRGYNDGIDEERRQDLYRYASQVVGTRRRSAVRERVSLSSAFFGVGESRLSRFAPRSWRVSVGRAAQRYAKSADAQAHREFLALVDALIGQPGARAVIPLTRSLVRAGSATQER